MQLKTEKASPIPLETTDFLWRNYKWVKNICLRYVYGKRPDLSGSARGEILVDGCINASMDKILSYAAARFDPSRGYAETTYVTRVVENVCNRVLKKHIDMEMTVIPNSDYQIKENQKYDEECDEVVQETEPIVDLDEILKPLLRNKNFERRIAVDYIRMVIETDKPKVKTLWKEKYSPEVSPRGMCYEWFRQKVRKIKQTLAQNSDFKAQLLENAYQKQLTQ